MTEFYQKPERGMFIFLDDLQLFAWFCLAKFIVWRTVRRRGKEDSERRKKFKLLIGGLGK